MDNLATSTQGGLSGASRLEEGRASQETQDGSPNQPSRTILDQVRAIDRTDVVWVAVLNFRALQLYRIAALQKDLLDIQGKLLKENEVPGETTSEETDTILQRYADAIRNYETLTQDIVYDKNVKYDFLGVAADFKGVEQTSAGPRIRGLWGLFSTAGPAVVLGRTRGRISALAFRELDKRRRIEKEKLDAFYLRLRMALFGGAALIVPMLIMALRPGLVVDLVTTSVATVLFGVATVIMATDSSGRDVLAATAAYAAVLVVFVGSSLTPASSSNSQ